ncbi:membrane-spanning 4-domains subfamily A member 4A [Tamandua tetradactyla]|uniref:membrane-spanning 4-domains subfamily A member 4A n=1 Tax=Tamandua tetradactyla TaxID=48850 RepID=UPI004054141A
MEQTTQEAGPGMPQLGQLAAVKPLLWKGKSEKFLKADPKILGIVQLLIALMMISFGIIVITVTFPYYQYKSFSVYTGYTLWGSVMFIISGSLSVAAGIRTTKGLVQSSLGMNVTSSVIAALGIIFHSVSLFDHAHRYYYCSHNDDISKNCYLAQSIFLGIDSLVLILSVLEFCIAVSLAVFGCKVSCCDPGDVVFILPSNSHVVETAPPSDKLEA